MDKLPRIAHMKDPVIVFDGKYGLYWRENSCGYTAAPEVAGVFERDKAPRCEERRLQYEPVPAQHVRRLQDRIAELEKIADIAAALHTRIVAERIEAVSNGKTRPDSSVFFWPEVNRLLEALRDVEDKRNG